MSSCGWCPERFERGQLRIAQRKRGIGFVWNPNVHNSQRCLFMLSRVVYVCRAVSILSVWLSSCSAVQNHLDHLNQWSSPYPVSHNPSMSLDHTNVDSMSSTSACVCERERVVLIALSMWTSLSEKTLMNCLFSCACQWPRGTAGPRNYLNGRSCISTAAGWFKGWRAG